MPLWPFPTTMRLKEEHIDYAPLHWVPHISQAADQATEAYIAPLDLCDLVQDDYETEPSDAALANADVQTVQSGLAATIAAMETSKPVIETAKMRETHIRYLPPPLTAHTTTKTAQFNVNNEGPQLEPHVPSDPWLSPQSDPSRYQENGMRSSSGFTNIESGLFDHDNNGIYANSSSIRDLPLAFPNSSLFPTPQRELSLPPLSAASTEHTSSGYKSTRTSASPFAHSVPLPTPANAPTPVPTTTTIKVQPILLHSRPPNPYANNPGALDRNIAFLRERLGFAPTVPISLESIPTQPLCERPAVLLRHLAALAILSSPDRVLTLQGIYRALMDRFPYFAKNNKHAAWMAFYSRFLQRSIRHALSLFKQFTNIGRAQGGSDKGGYWMLDIDKGEGYQRARKRLNAGNKRARMQAPTATTKKSKSSWAPKTKAKVYSDDEFESEDGDADFISAVAHRQTRISPHNHPYPSTHRNTRKTRG